MTVECGITKSISMSSSIPNPFMKKVVASGFTLLIIIQAFWGFQDLIDNSNSGSAYLNESGDKVNELIDPYQTRGVQIESDDMGGSWFDELEDNTGVERMENCSFVDGGIRLDETFYIDTWYYEDWPYRREFVVSNSGEVDLLGYQVNLQVPYFDGMNINFTDVRFTCYDGDSPVETDLPYWIEDRNTGEGANIWINVTLIPAMGDCTVFMYYGNQLALDESDGDGTFVFFDDFDGVNLDLEKWIEPSIDSTCTYSVNGGDLYLYVHNAWNYAINCTVKEKLNIDDHMIETRVRMEKGGTLRGNDNRGMLGLEIQHPRGNWRRLYGRSRKGNAWLRYSSSHTTNIWKKGAWNGADTGYHILGIGKYDDKVILYEDSMEQNTIQDEGISEDQYKTKINNIINGYDGNGWGKLWTDWYRMRRRVFPEPTVSLKSLTGTVESIPINLLESMKWDMLSVMKEEQYNNSILINIVDPFTDKIIPGYENLEMKNVDISGLNDLEINSIKLKAVFSGIDTIDHVPKGTRSDFPLHEVNTPFLNSWGVEWVADNAWRDSFIGDGKLDRRLSTDENTVALWHFDDGVGNTALDSSGKGNHGTITGASWGDGKIGGALEFDGVGDNIDLGALGGLDGPFTFEGWISLEDSGDLQFIFGRNGNFQRGYVYENTVFYHFEVDRVGYYSSWDEGQHQSIKMNSGMSEPMYIWHHIAITRDSSGGVVIYVDGINRGGVSQKHL